MRRLFWLAMGVTIGVLVVRKLSMAAEQLKPQALASRTGRGASSLAEQARLFVADVLGGMHQRERQLLDGVGIDADPTQPEDI